jgi:acetyl-CoA carboxylase biotin carboxyl carrier protein
MNQVIEDKLRELLAFAEEHGLLEMAWQENGLRISFRRSQNTNGSKPNPIPASKEEEPAFKETEVVIRSPMVGRFRRAPSKDSPPMVMEGNHVKPGDRLGTVHCMKIPNDVVSYCSGRIQKILVEDGQAVEYGQPLFSVVTNGAFPINV